MLIKFLGDKLLYGHIPDPFPRCGIESGHARLLSVSLASSRVRYLCFSVSILNSHMYMYSADHEQVKRCAHVTHKPLTSRSSVKLQVCVC